MHSSARTVPAVSTTPAISRSAGQPSVIGTVPPLAPAARRATSRLVSMHAGIPVDRSVAGTLTGHGADEAEAAGAEGDAADPFEAAGSSQGPDSAGRPAEADDLAVLARLTPREREVAVCVGRGLNVHEIATELGRARTTVISHRRALIRKIGCRDALGIARFTYRTGLAEP